MQPNVVTLSVDVDNDGGTTAAVERIFTRFNEFSNRSEYISSLHSVAARDKLGFYRTFPKASGNFRGTAKMAAKFTKDILVPGVDATTSVTCPAIGEISFSFPVGMTNAEMREFRMHFVALLRDDAVMVPLTTQLMV